MTCFWCSCQLLSKTLTIDHYIPLSKGGSNRLNNLRLACRSYNLGRSNSLPTENRHERHHIG
ncbi:HNH endonuclease [uncultured Nostoc sp.]|uniref:HNH endonuclease n=1 Tax=uncultured Nostoc sp. TaxID=340711 RepID=UPI0035CBBCA9